MNTTRGFFAVLGLCAAVLISGCKILPTMPGEGPPGHTVVKGGYLHMSGLILPTVNCTSCHGTTLRGTSKAPSCFRCHGQKW